MKDRFERMSDTEFSTYLQSVEFAELKKMSYAIKFGEFGIDFYRARQKPLADKLKQFEDTQKAERMQHYVEPETVQASCGHIVERANLMNASLGTTCPECYDRLSD